MKSKFVKKIFEFGIIFIISFLTIQSSFIFQNSDVDVYNSFIREGKNEFNQYVISLVDNVGFFQKNDRGFYRESEPIMFRRGKGMSNSVEYTLLESWQLFFENQNPIKDQMYQRIQTWYGSAVDFDSGYKIGMSTELFKILFPEKDFTEFSSIIFKLDANNHLITAKISFLYNASLFDWTSNRGKLYKTIYGINCLFVNKIIAEELSFNALNIVYYQNNYSKLYNYKLFKSFSSNQVNSFQCFSETTNIINYNLKLCKDLRVLRIFCLLLDVLIVAGLIYFSVKKQRIFISNYMFGLSFSVSIMGFALIERFVKKIIIIPSTSFWFIFLVGLVFLIFLSVMHRFKEKYYSPKELYEISI